MAVMSMGDDDNEEVKGHLSFECGATRGNALNYRKGRSAAGESFLLGSWFARKVESEGEEGGGMTEQGFDSDNELVLARMVAFEGVRWIMS